MELQKAIEEMGKQIGKGADQIFPYYERWFFINAIAVITAGVTFLIAGFLLMWFSRAHQKRLFYLLAAGGCFMLGISLVCGWMPDLLCPGGYAWHQIIKDVCQK